MVIEALKRLMERRKTQVEEPRPEPPTEIITRKVIAPPISTGRGLSPFQRRIIRRELIMKRVRATPPLERPKMLMDSDPFRRRIKEIRGTPEPKKSQITIDSKVQDAEAELNRKIREATQRSKPGRI